MTVAELIKKLKKYKGSYRVLLENCDKEVKDAWCCFDEVIYLSEMGPFPDETRR